VNDLKFAFRHLLKNPGFTVVAVLTLALGIGANTAIFTIIITVLLRWLPLKNPEELLQVVVTSGSPDRRTPSPIRSMNDSGITDAEWRLPDLLNRLLDATRHGTS
jgi:hypothetical protein